MDFAGKRRIFYVVSLVLILAGIFSLAFRGLNLGVDFTGGNLIQFQFAKEVSPEEVRQVLKGFGLERSPLQESEASVFLLRTSELSEEQSKKLLGALQEKLGSLEVLRNEKVGAVISSELRRNAILSLLIASALMLLYITFRFEFYFGVAAILALVHDVLVTVGIFSLFQIEIDSSFVAALLTLVGYSINDTIVVFDRIRENLKLIRKETLAEVVNKSISQTIVRSINTSLTVVMALVALLLLGGTTLKVFSLALLIGIITGTYSSIFVASPLWLEFQNWVKKRGSPQRAKAT